MTGSVRTARRLSALRTLERLRSGTPPFEDFASLTHGYGDLASTVPGFLSATDRATRILWVKGVYGSGKSHMLGAIREIAQGMSFATSVISADGSENALNCPQRIASGILQHLEMPVAGGTIGYASLLERCLASPVKARRLERVIGELLPENRDLHYRARTLSVSVVRCHDAGEAGSDGYAPSIVAELVSVLSAETISSLPSNRNVRQAAYRLLHLAQILVRSEGARGLLVTIDEVESVFTKLRSILSRRGAYRTLAALGHADREDSLRLVCALTPDSERQIQDEIGLELRWTDHLPEERTDALIAEWRNGRRLTVDCKPLSGCQLADLIATVCAIYADVHGLDADLLARDLGEMSARVAQAGTGITGARQVVREAMDRLDAFRFGNT